MISRPFEVVSATSGFVVFDGLKAVAWTVLMNASLSAHGIVIKNIAPGQLYTFTFKQDATGGHTIEWPAKVINGMSIDTRSSAVSVQNYIGVTGGVLRSDIPGAWGEV